jgi:hypothetical protein
MKNNDIGCVLTPLKWAKWAIEKYNIVKRWLDGAVILEPTAGQGVFLEALISLAQSAGHQVTDELLRQLFAVELKPEFRDEFLDKIKNRYKLDFPSENFISGDYLLEVESPVADIVIGNPPWVNFTDLEDDYKERLKPLFLHYGLVRGRSTLLGGARVDLSALVIAKALTEGLKPGGDAYFYMPLSILLNDGAHDAFRKYNMNGVDFAVREVHDQTAAKVFSGIGTNYCFCAFKRDAKPGFPVAYHEYLDSEKIVEKSAFPAYGDNSPLMVTEQGEVLPPVPRISVAKASFPRQGVNTCGANDVFIFDQFEAFGDGLCKLGNKVRDDIILPTCLVYPLLGKSNFDNPVVTPERYIFIPHNRQTGKPLSEADLSGFPAAWNYLQTVRERLAHRRGSMINSSINKGLWWAMLGVGVYSFAPFKIAWLAYGVDKFKPIFLETSADLCWQGNNALQAFMPFTDKADAERVYDELTTAPIEKYLLLHRTGSSCNWAQPGRIKKFLVVSNSA